VVEINAGPGHTTSHLLDRVRLVVTDVDPVHVETLRRRFGHMENLEIQHIDIDRAPLDAEGLDTAILFDGLQRAREPKQLLANVAASLRSGGKILIQVPADTALFGSTDKAAGHVRRFDREDLEDVIRSAGLELILIEPFNRLGVIGWRLHHALGAGRISAAEARGFDALVPLAKRIDAVASGRGLSWLAVARVP
jgi:SAM-dependent methyltransferase